MDDTTRRLVLVALAVAEYDTAVTSMEALRRMGRYVPTHTLGWARAGRERWALGWVTRMGPDFTPLDVERVVQAARSYLADHTQEISELLNQE